jgi:hypothetical protein
MGNVRSINVFGNSIHPQLHPDNGKKLHGFLQQSAALGTAVSALLLGEVACSTGPGIGEVGCNADWVTSFANEYTNGVFSQNGTGVDRAAYNDAPLGALIPRKNGFIFVTNQKILTHNDLGLICERSRRNNMVVSGPLDLHSDEVRGLATNGILFRPNFDDAEALLATMPRFRISR